MKQNNQNEIVLFCTVFLLMIQLIPAASARIIHSDLKKGADNNFQYFSDSEAKNDKWKVELIKVFPWEGEGWTDIAFRFRVKNLREGGTFEFELSDMTASIKELGIFEDRLVIWGQYNGDYFAIYDLKKRAKIFRFQGGNSALSPNGRYIAHTQRYGRAYWAKKSESISHRVRIYDVKKPPLKNVEEKYINQLDTDTLPNSPLPPSHVVGGLQVYPSKEANDKERLRIGKLVWSSASPELAFIASDQIGETDKVVLIDLSDGIEQPEVKQREFARGELFVKRDNFYTVSPDRLEVIKDGVIKIHDDSLKKPIGGIIDLLSPNKDLQAPEIEMNFKGSSKSEGHTYFSPRGEIEITGKDVGINPSGLKEIEYKLDGKTVVTTDTRVILRTNKLNEGEHKLEALAVDRAGNKSPFRTVKFKVDLSSPEIQVDVPFQDKKRHIISPEAKFELQGEDRVSKLEAIYFRMDGGRLREYKRPFQELELGNHVMEFWGEDLAGNKSVPDTFSFLLLDVRAETNPLPLFSNSVSQLEPLKIDLDELYNQTSFLRR